jgi:DNA-binding transcriptional regulator YiaG
MPTRVDVKALRSQFGENRESFGKRFPVDKRTVRRWENGEVEPSPMALKQLDALRLETGAEPGPRRRSERREFTP